MDRQRLIVNPDPDPTFHFDTEPDPVLTPSFTYFGKSDFLGTSIHSNAGLRCFFFLGSVIDVITFNISKASTVYKNFVGKVWCYG
jgi:hypothetical protein